ncbi:RHS repeat domain-containing protein [Gimesia sp.]|uniref:RHS repeat domain-containing protein n=1 Tax=Gimesia sp. TaxID=2024833 RepID=UPI003A941C06
MTVTNYLWDQDSYLEEYDDVGTTTAAYSNEPTIFGMVVSQQRSTSTSFYHYDAQGSTHQLTDQNENVTDTFLYDAWGNDIARTGTTIAPFRFIGNLGYYFDEEVLSYYVRARVYQPMIGRWLSVDPLGFVDSINRYCYVANRPRFLYDPSGTQQCSYCGPEILQRLVATLKEVQKVAASNFSKSGAKSGVSINDMNWRCGTGQTQWDILDLYISARLEVENCPLHSECCKRCVTVGGFKQDRYEVNYVLWGLLSRLCNGYLWTAKASARAWKLGKGSTGRECEEGYTEYVEKWVEAGWKFASIRAVVDFADTSGTWMKLENIKSEPISMNMPTKDKPIFNDCKYCDEKAKGTGSFEFSLWEGMGNNLGGTIGRPYE